MTPAEHRAEAERLMSVASKFTGDPAKDLLSVSLVKEAALLTAQAQVHAALALAPPPAAQPPQHRWSLDQTHHFPDATGGQLIVLPVKDAAGVVISLGEDAALMENPDILRTLASLLAAHADRLESRS